MTQNKQSPLTAAMLLGPRSAGLRDSIVMGLDKKGQFHFATTAVSANDALFLIECARTRLMAVIEIAKQHDKEPAPEEPTNA